MKRTGKIFIDYNMNVRGKTLNVAYSPRGVPGRAGLHAPDLGGAGGGRADRLHAYRTWRTRLDRTGDRWHDVFRAKQSLAKAFASNRAKRNPEANKRTASMAAPRSIGSLTISFGLVAIPVKLYTATQSTGADLLQPAAQGLRLAPQAAVRLPEGRADRRARRHGQGLRVREGPVRRLHARGDQGARGGGHALGRDLGVRADRVRSIRCTSTRRITSRPTRVRRSRTRCSPRRSRNRSAARSAAGPARARRTS